jgi:hypothetical protein
LTEYGEFELLEPGVKRLDVAPDPIGQQG